MCFGRSKEPSHQDGSFDHPQHMFWLRNKKNNFQLPTLIWGPAMITFANTLNHAQGGGGTLIFSYMHRLGPFFWVQNFEFEYFLGFSEK